MSQEARFGESVVMTRIGGQDYPLRTISRCATCNSPHRLYIESELVKGVSYATIAREVEGMPDYGRPVPSAHSISQHVRGSHLPLPQNVQRRIIERRAKQVGASIEDADNPLTDYLTLNQMIVQKGVEKLASGDLDIKTSDLISASKFLHEVEKQATDGNDSQIWMEALMAYMEIAVSFIPVESQAAYGAALHASPVLRSIAVRMAKQNQIEGEVVDDEDED